MIQYTILEDRCQTGKWTDSLKDDDGIPGGRLQIFTEIARKNAGQQDGRSGSYCCAWIDKGPEFKVVRTRKFGKRGVFIIFSGGMEFQLPLPVWGCGLE